jgi:SAM-dependent methyltransferase
MGGRVFLRTLDPGNKLPFAEETFDRVLAHAVLGEMPHPAARADHVADLARVTAPGGTVAATFALRGSFGEVLDLFDEALVRLGRPDRREALDAHRAAQPDGPTLVRECEHAGLEAVQVAVSRWEVLFRSGRELFYAPVIEQGPLPAWKALAAGDGGAPRERNAAMQAVFLAVKEAVDTYAGGHGFAVSVVAARVSGYRRGEDTAP